MTVGTAVSVSSLVVPPTFSVNLGVEIHKVNLDSLLDVDFELIRDLYRKDVTVLKNQAHAAPEAQYELRKRFDPTVTKYGHGKTLDAKRSVLHPDLENIPHQPQIQIIGNGVMKSFQGLKNIKLVYLHHKKLHKEPLQMKKDYS